MARTLTVILTDAVIRRNKLDVARAARELGDTQTDKAHASLPRRPRFPRPVDCVLSHGMQVFTMPGLEEAPTVLFYHGSAYIHPFSNFHWRFLALLARETGCGLRIPNYPLLPNHTWRECRDRVLEDYRDFAAANDMDRVALLGDSAGGGLGLALLQQARDLGLPLPRRGILISPWADVSGGSDALNALDAMLTTEPARMFGRAWAAGDDWRLPPISPLYGDMAGLPPVTLYTGSREILSDDVLRLHRKLESAAVPVTLRVGQGLGHDYPFYPIPQGRSARREIGRLILQ